MQPVNQKPVCAIIEPKRKRSEDDSESEDMIVDNSKTIVPTGTGLQSPHSQWVCWVWTVVVWAIHEQFERSWSSCLQRSPFFLFFYFFMETLVERTHVEKLRIRIGFDGAFCVDRRGRGGGLIMMWKTMNTANLISYSTNHIDIQVNLPDTLPWRLTGLYGFPER